jgi:hypothetical protein
MSTQDIHFASMLVLHVPAWQNKRPPPPPPALLIFLLLPAEAIRESDIAKLSFAVQLAEGMFARRDTPPALPPPTTTTTTFDTASASNVNGNGAESAGAVDPQQQQRVSGAFEPGSLLFLIQRDFLEGSGAQQAVDTALAVVPNPQVSEAQGGAPGGAHVQQ